MVFGNMGQDCATGVAFTRNPGNGENQFYGEYLINAQGEDVVAGIRTPAPINEYSKSEHNKGLVTLEKAMPAHVMVSTDIGNINSVANSYLRFNKPRSFFAAMSWGNCGYAFPTIIGAKVAAPHRPAVSYAGDGAWGMSLMETMTCVRHNIPVTAVVFHNRQWGAEKKNQVDFYNRRFVAGELDNQSFAEIARAMGAEGITVDRLEDVGPALKRAIDMQMNEGKTTIIEIRCTRELGDPFRRDALSKPVRMLDKYKDYV
jgi:sulfoacetaldehyde acetyltransferase